MGVVKLKMASSSNLDHKPLRLPLVSNGIHGVSDKDRLGRYDYRQSGHQQDTRSAHVDTSSRVDPQQSAQVSLLGLDYTVLFVSVVYWTIY